MKKKMLVLSSFPANYRVAAIEGLAKDYDITVVFNAVKDQERNPKWFVGQEVLSYYVMDTKEHRRAAERVLKNIRQYDIIFAYDWVMPWSLPLLLRAMLLRIPYLLNSDGAFPEKRGFPKEQIKRFFISGAAAWIASGRYARENFIHYGADPARIFEHRFSSLHRSDILAEVVSAAEKSALRQRLGLPDKTTFLSIGQFIERKGFDILLEGWRGAQAEDRQLVILGGGGKRAEYEEQIRRDGLKNVLILDFVPFEEVWDYYKASDAFVLATREDIWGLVVNESMACGLPVIVSDRCIAGLELIENGQNGFIIDGNLPELWSERISQLASQMQLRAEMGHRNLEKIRGWCLEETNAIDLLAAERAIRKQ